MPHLLEGPVEQIKIKINLPGEGLLVCLLFLALVILDSVRK